MRKTAITIMTAALVLTGASAASAQTQPVCDSYSKKCPATAPATVEAPSDEEVVVVEPAGVEAESAVTEVLGVKVEKSIAATTGGATLPMTGAELSGLVLAGLALVGGGIALTVASRRRNSPTA
ncbi:MAG: LPXTG cell wall anchor domain-containing protein [Mycobacteriales bacterium]